MILKNILNKTFHRVHRISAWGRNRFTPAGRLVLGGLLAATVFGVDTRQTMSFQIAAVLFALLLIGIASAPLFRVRFRLRRCLPETASVGIPCRYGLELTPLTGDLQRGLQLTDRLVGEPPSPSEMSRHRNIEIRGGNRFDRVIGFPRWLRLLERKRGGSIDSVALPDLEVGQTTRVALCFTPLRRGYLEFGATLIQRPDPLGLFHAIIRLPAPERLLVLPRRYALPPLRLRGGRSYQPGGLEQASSVGDAQEFVSLRDYRPGDPPRHIHWKSWAHTGHPVVREYEDEYFIRQGLLLDTWLEQGPDNLFEEAVSLAASYACMPRDRDSLLDLLFAGNRAHVFTSGRGLADTRALLEVLACVEQAEQDPFPDLEAMLGQHAPRLNACICILLAWDEKRQALIRLLRDQGLDTHVVVLHCPDSPPPAPGVMADQPRRFETWKPGDGEHGAGAATRASPRARAS